MDETPSNYNIPNGRFDGRSLGGGVFLEKAFKTNSKLITKLPKGTKKKKKEKLFKEETTTQEIDETIEDYHPTVSGQLGGGADSRSHSVLRKGGGPRRDPPHETLL